MASRRLLLADRLRRGRPWQDPQLDPPRHLHPRRWRSRSPDLAARLPTGGDPAPRGTRSARAAHPGRAEPGRPMGASLASLKASAETARRAPLLRRPGRPGHGGGQMGQWEITSDITRFNTAPARPARTATARRISLPACWPAPSGDRRGNRRRLRPGPRGGDGAVGLRRPGLERRAVSRAAGGGAASAAGGWRRLVQHDGLPGAAGRPAPGPLGHRQGVRRRQGGRGAGKALGVASFLLEVGGEMRGQGCAPTASAVVGQPASPASGFAPSIRIALPGWSVATFGRLSPRASRRPGRRYSHTFDLRQSGAPVEGGVDLGHGA